MIGIKIRIYHEDFCYKVHKDIYLEGIVEKKDILYNNYFWYRITKVFHKKDILHSWKVGTLADCFADDKNVIVLSPDLQLDLFTQ